LLEWTWNLRAKIMNYYYSFLLIHNSSPKKERWAKDRMHESRWLRIKSWVRTFSSVLTEKIGKDIWKQCFFILKWLFFKVFFT
jgi:hypothetical protein